MSNTKVFIVIHNDCQFTNYSPNIIGVLSTLDNAFLMGWKTIVEKALKPWSLDFYKNRYHSTSCGMGSYTVEVWDINVNKKLLTYMLGERKIQSSRIINVIDTYLKEHHEDCEILLQQWLDAIVSGTLPEELRMTTFLRT